MHNKQLALLPEEIATSLSRTRGQQTDPHGYKIVSVRLREAEFEAFNAQAVALGITNNMALRIAARKIGGFLELDARTQQALETIIGEIGDISHAINQLNAAYAQSGRVDMQEFQAQRAAFGYEFAKLDATLMSMLNVSQRRLDGRLKLKDASK
ncbi:MULTISPECIES: DNA mobilization endonuclease VirD1/MobC family subunit [unclassified Neorhizobium]|uniref:DNA mobilization endonuclease VirD1/MobC family subunit n=1 Tax=unclassified Neorhizobium TaxID=2629175 RepID=UPI001FF5FECE|nr:MULTISPECIES: DNA mobilization endonuclease VirD1/MobC family subunit [unclassified Neorhizobium]MCJ9674097.1 DNA mobilization endonuclease VirD1/MobC family subunit [Neorhizobium sp. SHOUNA12B]MCJ9746281.1 DNA mobilization endonuclease VirD1/MobC family subunit [Neorhizobium sp. SHOUNA12A]